MDPAGFDEWVRLSAPRLHRSAFVLTGDWALAEDLVQHACAVTWRQFAALDNPDGFAQTVMARTASSWWRRRWRGEVPHANPPDHTADDPWDAVADGAAVQAALLRLPVRQRAVLVMRFVADMSEADTAAALGWPPGTVKSTTARALAALRTAGLSGSEARS